MNIKRLRLLSLLLTIALATNSLHTTLPAADAGAEVSTLGKFNTHLKENTHKYAIGLGAAGLLNLAYLFKSGKLSKAKLKKLFAKENRAATTQLFFGSILPFLLAGGVEVNGYGSGYAKEQAKPQHNSSTAISHQSTAGEAPATTSETAPLDDAASNASSDILAAASAPTAEFSNSQNTKEEEATLLPASTVAGKNGDTSKSHVVAATAQGQRTQAEKPAQKPTKEMSASLVEKNPTITMPRTKAARAETTSQEDDAGVTLTRWKRNKYLKPGLRHSIAERLVQRKADAAIKEPKTLDEAEGLVKRAEAELEWAQKMLATNNATSGAKEKYAKDYQSAREQLVKHVEGLAKAAELRRTQRAQIQGQLATAFYQWNTAMRAEQEDTSEAATTEATLKQQALTELKKKFDPAALTIQRVLRGHQARKDFRGERFLGKNYFTTDARILDENGNFSAPTTTKEQDQGNAAEFRPVGLAQLIKNASPDEVPTTLDRAEELLALASLAHVDADREERLRVANEKLHAISAMLQVKLSNAYNSYRASGSTTEIRRLLRQNQKRLKDNEDALAAYNNKSVISNAPLDVAAFRAALKEKAKTLAALVERRTAERDALLFKHNMSLAKSSIENDTISWVKALERAEAEYAKRSASDPEREMLEQAIESIKANLGELDSPERAADYVAREAKLKRRAIKEVHEKEEATARAAGVVGTRKTVVKQIDLHTKKLQEVKVALAALPTETAGSTSSMLSSNTSDLSMRHELKRIMNDLTEKLDSLTRDLEFLTEEDGKRRVQPSDYEHAVTLLSEAEDSLREFNTAHPGRHVDLSKDEKDRLAVLTHDVKNRKKQADAINSAKNAFSLNSSFSKYDLKKLRDLEAQLVIATAANDTEQIAALNVEIDATRAELARRRDMMILKEIKSAKDIEGLKEIFEEELARNSGEDERVSAPVINPNYNKKHLKARKDFMSHQHLMKKEHFMTKRISKKAIIARIKELNDALKEPDRQGARNKTRKWLAQYSQWLPEAEQTSEEVVPDKGVLQENLASAGMSSSFMPSSGSISSPQYFVPIRISAEPLRAELGLMEAVVNPLDSHTTSESPE